MKLTNSPHENNNKPKLLDQVRYAIRAKHNRIRTEEAYVRWIRRYIFFHGRKHPREMGANEINVGEGSGRGIRRRAVELFAIIAC